MTTLEERIAFLETTLIRTVELLDQLATIVIRMQDAEDDPDCVDVGETRHRFERPRSED